MILNATFRRSYLPAVWDIKGILLAILLSLFFDGMMSGLPAAPPGAKALLPPVVEPKMVEKKTPAVKGKAPTKGATDTKTKKEMVKVPLTKQQELQNAQAKLEAGALEDMAKDRFAEATKKYEDLSKQLSGSKFQGAIDLRIADLQQRMFKKNGLAEPFLKVLLKLADRYHNDQHLGPENQAQAKKVYQLISRIAMGLVQKEIRTAMNPKVAVAARKQTIKLLQNFLESVVPSDAEKQEFKAQRGELEFLNQNHKEAAGTFAGLAMEVSGNKVSLYWAKAIRSQNVLADWPVAPPWEGSKDGHASEREVLLGMYGHLSKPGDWPTNGHMGLLNIKLGRKDDGQKILWDTLQKTPRGEHAIKACGLLAQSMTQEKNWGKLEELGRLQEKSNLTGQFNKVSYPPKEVLSLALLEGGLELYNRPEYKGAIAKLEEFTKRFTWHKRYDQGFYFLAMSHQGAGNYRVALETLIQFTKTFPQSKYRRDALVNGGSWSLGLAWEDHVMYFLEAHIKEFPKDAQIPGSLETLASLYMGREVFDAAGRIMTMQIKHPKIDRETKIDVARRLLDMNERQASSESALAASNIALKDFGDIPHIKATALSLRARIYAKESPKKLASVTKDLFALDAGDRTVSEAQSEIRFLIAEDLAKDAFETEIFSLESKHPLIDLNQTYNQYEKMRQAYEAACANTGSSWCGPATHRLARLSEKYLKSVSPLEIPSTLDPNDVQTFKSRKKSILETVEQRILQADERSLTEAKAGATNPDWTGAILWQNSTEWYSERVTGDTGKGFIQWRATATQ
jgi:hypothetical protein